MPAPVTARRDPHAGLCDFRGPDIERRGGDLDIVEGAPGGHALVIVEFPSMATAKAWYASADYAEALKFRDAALTRRLTFVEGVSV